MDGVCTNKTGISFCIRQNLYFCCGYEIDLKINENVELKTYSL